MGRTARTRSSPVPYQSARSAASAWPTATATATAPKPSTPGQAGWRPTWEIARQDRDLTVGHLVAGLQTLGVPDDRIGGIGALVLPVRDAIVTA